MELLNVLRAMSKENKKKSFYQNFLEDNGLIKPDGRLLYEYKITDKRFSFLQSSLKEYYSKRDFISTSNDCLFVLYASIWWQREYDGGLWSWDGIFRSLNIDCPPNTRSEIVRNGFKKWEIPISKNKGSNEYLGTIILNAGIPLKVLNDSTWLSNTIIKCFKSYGKDKNILSVSSNFQYVPETLNKEEFRNLILIIVKELYVIQKNYDLKGKTNPFEYLQNISPDWAKKIPVPLDKKECQIFLNKLLSETAKIFRKASRHLFKIERFLVKDDNHCNPWNLSLEFKTEKFVPFSILEEMLQAPFHKFSSTNGFIVGEDGQELFSLGKLFKTTKSDKEGYRFEKSYKLPSSIFNHKLFLHIDGIDSFIPIPLSEEIDNETIVTFVPIKDSHNKFSYLGMGSQSSKEPALYVMCHQFLNSYNLKEHALIDDSIKIYLINQETSFDCYSIRPSYNQPSENYTFDGNKILSYKSNKTIYLGKPTLYTIDRDYNDKTSNNYEFYSKKDGSLIPFTNEDYGTYKVYIKCRHTKTFLTQSKLTVLPENFKIRLEPYDTRTGKIFITKIKGFDISILNEDVNYTSSHDEENIIIDLEMKGVTFVNDIIISLYKHGDARNKNIKITVPFPAKGISVFSGNGDYIEPDKDFLYLQELYGVVIQSVHSTQLQRSIRLEFKLCDDEIKNINQKNLCFKDEISTNKQYHSISLNPYRDKISELFSISNHIDSYVELSISNNQNKPLSLRIYQFADQLEFDERLNCVSLKNRKKYSLDLIQATEISLLSFQNPNEIIPSLKVVSAISNADMWYIPQFKENILLFPSGNSSIKFRPFLYMSSQTENNNVQRIKTLHKAASLSNREERLQYMNLVLQDMLKDLSHSGWDYLFAIYKKTKHIPMVTFDIWRVIAENAQACTMLMFIQPAISLGLEKEFPILWESFPLPFWKESFKKAKSYLEEKYSRDEDGVELASMRLKKSVKLINEALNLTFIARQLREEFFGEDNSQEKALMSNQMIVEKILSEEYRGKQDEIGLIGRQSTEKEKFPLLLSKTIEKYFDNMPLKAKSICPIPTQEYHKTVLYLPFILAYQHFSQEIIHWKDYEIYSIKQIKEFDYKWFIHSFEWSQEYYNKQYNVENKGAKSEKILPYAS